MSLWFISRYLLSEPYLTPLIVSQAALIGAFVTIVLSVISTLYRTKYQNILTALIMSSLSATLLLSIASTGNMNSPYLALWVLAALFGAVAGAASFIPICIVAMSFGVYLWVNHIIPISDWVIFALAIVFPILIGLFIWIRRFQMQDHSSQAVTALASELNQESSKSSIIINAIADGVLLIDKNGIVQLINPAAEQIIGWGKEDATKLDYRSVLKIIDSNDQVVEAALDPVGQCLSTRESVITDKFGIRTISGKNLLSSIMASPLGEGASGVIVVFRDITAQRAEEKDQAEFISTASHEMRTPVAAIEGYLGLALNPATASIDEKARSYLLKAHESAQNLGRLFQDLLDVSKVEDGRISNKPSMVDIPSAVRGMLDDFRGQLTEKSLNLIYAPDTRSGAGQTVEPMLYANVDTGHFQEVVSNLITNAIKYTKEGGVTVDVTADDDHVFVSVSDTGIGIPAEDIPHLFQKFYRVDNSDTREIGGTGLGLYLARRLTESMRGRLTLNSTYGKGSTFTVELPRVSKEEAMRVIATATNTAEVTPEQTIL